MSGDNVQAVQEGEAMQEGEVGLTMPDMTRMMASISALGRAFIAAFEHFFDLQMNPAHNADELTAQYAKVNAISRQLLSEIRCMKLLSGVDIPEIEESIARIELITRNVARSYAAQ